MDPCTRAHLREQLLGVLRKMPEGLDLRDAVAVLEELLAHGLARLEIPLRPDFSWENALDSALAAIREDVVEQRALWLAEQRAEEEVTDVQGPTH